MISARSPGFAPRRGDHEHDDRHCGEDGGCHVDVKAHL
jgi:hypothetical protein